MAVDIKAIAKKRQKKRTEAGIYKTKEGGGKPKFYILDMFPYPSGAGLHVGHPKGYVASDTIARKKMLEGYNVLHPMGFDTFGLGTELYAIEHKMKPQVVSEKNIQTYIQQLEDIGFTYDRERSFSTADPKYFKWTQAIFLKFYNHYYDEKTQKARPISELEAELRKTEKSESEIRFILDNERLAYLDYKPINRCPHCKTGLANEDLEDGKCERCGSEVEQKPMRQRVLRITKYAQRLLDGLDNLEREESMKELERNWIGKSEGSQFKMRVKMPENKAENIREYQEVPENESENAREQHKDGENFTDGTYEIIGCAMDVHKQLGPGLQEKIYHTALLKQLAKKGFKVESEKNVSYKVDNEIVGYGKVDLVVNDTIALELKSRKITEGDFYKQLRAYINHSNTIQTGLLLNFYNGKLEYKRLEKDYISKNQATTHTAATLNKSEENTKSSDKILGNSQNHSQEFFEVYTTRLDTVFGMSFVVMAPEHPLVEKITTPEQLETVKAYQEQAKHKTQLERTELQKEKTGVFTGAYAINPFNNQEVPIYIGDYVLANYGTGVVMAVPAHDERDFDFARKYNIPVIQSILPEDKENYDFTSFESLPEKATEKGILLNSGEFSGLSSDEAIAKMQTWLAENNLGGKKTNFKIQDWVFSRQRYRGEPFPVVFCEEHGVVPLQESDLPLCLPDIEHYEPTGTEEGPLAEVKERIETTCPICGKPAKRESNTMPGWAGSSRYWLRYMDPHNEELMFAQDKEQYWKNVDIYVGGAEHVTRHMIYARFWQNFLYDLGLVSEQEPFKKYQKVGLIMAEDGRKMSKRRGNVVNPDDIIAEYGADVFRTYEMFMGPFDQYIAWNTSGIKGVKKFLDKVIALSEKVDEKLETEDKKLNALLHQSIKKLTSEIDDFRFNTAIAQLMILVNGLSEAEQITKATFEQLVILLAPFAPHLAEELWEQLGNPFSIFTHGQWPKYDESLLVSSEVTLAVQFNGKMRGTLQVAADCSQEEVLELIKKDEKLASYLTGSPKKIIFVQGKIINIIV